MSRKCGLCPFSSVPWMSGLVSGLQNHVRRFESARYLEAPQSGAFFISYYFSMADNYLEKKMEQHRARAGVSAVAKGRGSLLSLLEKCGSALPFDGYVVREDQLQRIVAAATQVASSFFYDFFTGAAAVELSCAVAALQPAGAFVLVCAPASCSDRLLPGRVVQVMALQAAEMGLCARVVTGCDAALAVPEAFTFVALVAVGRIK